MDIENDDLGLAKYRRVRLMIDVSKPLRRLQKISGKNNNIVSIEFKYERLPFFCFLCGIMGHSEKDCHLAADEGSKKQLGWGHWLKVSPRKGRQKVLAEEAEVLQGRKSLFVSKLSEVKSSPANEDMMLMGAQRDVGVQGDPRIAGKIILEGDGQKCVRDVAGDQQLKVREVGEVEHDTESATKEEGRVAGEELHG